MDISLTSALSPVALVDIRITDAVSVYSAWYLGASAQPLSQPERPQFALDLELLNSAHNLDIVVNYKHVQLSATSCVLPKDDSLI